MAERNRPLRQGVVRFVFVVLVIVAALVFWAGAEFVADVPSPPEVDYGCNPGSAYTVAECVVR